MFPWLVAVSFGRPLCVGSCGCAWRGVGCSDLLGAGYSGQRATAARQREAALAGGQGGKAAGSPTGPRTASSASMKDNRSGSRSVSSAAAQISSRIA